VVEDEFNTYISEANPVSKYILWIRKIIINISVIHIFPIYDLHTQNTPGNVFHQPEKKTSYFTFYLYFLAQASTTLFFLVFSFHNTILGVKNLQIFPKYLYVILTKDIFPEVLFPGH
jgi:hypothetical protein